MISEQYASKSRGSADWRVRAYILLMRLAEDKRMPSQHEWTLWTELVHDAARDREESGWVGDDPLYDAAFADGYSSAMAEVEEEDSHNPAGPYPYA